MGNECSLYTGEEDPGDLTDARYVRVAPHVTAIPEDAFNYCTELLQVDISNVTEIGAGAFRMCTRLRSVDLRNVTTIGERAFADCVELRAVDFLNVTKIEDRAFESCSSLEEITVPPTVDTIGEGAFSNCSGLAKVKLDDGLLRIEGEAFMCCTSLKAIEIPSSVRFICHSAFCNCINLANIILSEGLKSIGSKAFEHCTSLQHVNIPSTIVGIGPHAFRRCRRLISAELCGGVQRMSPDAFLGCPSLEHIQIPSPSFVISRGARDTLQCRFLSDERSPIDVQMVVSKCVRFMSTNQQSEAERRVNAILSGRGHPDQPMYKRISRIRTLLEHFVLLEVAALLELAIWKAHLGDAIGVTLEDWADGFALHNYRRLLELRQACRRRCGQDMNVIIPSVLAFCDRSS